MLPLYIPIPQAKCYLPRLGRRNTDDNVFANRQTFADFLLWKNDDASAVGVIWHD